MLKVSKLPTLSSERDAALDPLPSSWSLHRDCFLVPRCADRELPCTPTAFKPHGRRTVQGP